jgi:hypothetical protein
MPISLPLDTMTTEEKIQAMESIWNDLCRHADSLASPDWHKTVLAEREAAIERGEDEFVDWATARRAIKKDL